MKRDATGSSFCSPGRINHNSAGLYASKLRQSLPKEEMVKHTENADPRGFPDRIFRKSSQKMAGLPDSGVHLMVRWSISGKESVRL